MTTDDKKKRPSLFSGIQPSGRIHIGNYFGAIQNWIRLIEDYEAIFCIVDYHAITAPYNPEELPALVMDAAIDNMACGLDPTRCRLFVQSHVPEHTELTWVFNCVTPYGNLTRMTQFKDRVRVHQQNATVGVFDYPVLQAADILLYRAETVPVGEDQKQHLELTRDIARWFNARFGQVFPEPKTVLGKAPKIIGLDGEKKMSKSLDNDIALADPPDTVWKKLAPAVTDTARQRRTDPGNPEVCNIFSYHKLVSSADQIATVDQECRRAGIGCFDCKKIVAENLNSLLAPIQERRRELEGKSGEVHDILAEGANQVRPIARQTMEEVRSRMGLRG